MAVEGSATSTSTRGRSCQRRNASTLSRERELVVRAAGEVAVRARLEPLGGEALVVPDVQRLGVAPCSTSAASICGGGRAGLRPANRAPPGLGDVSEATTSGAGKSVLGTVPPRPTVSETVSETRSRRRPAGNEDERAAHVARAELRERLVRLLERERLDLGAHRHARREREELLAVAARQVRDRADARARPRAARTGRTGCRTCGSRRRRRCRPSATARERGGHELAGRREDDRGVELLGRRPDRRPTPRRASGRTPAPASSPSRVTANTRRPCAARDLRDDVRRGAEPVQPEPLRVAREPQRAVADQAGAEQRRRLEVAVPVRDREAEALVGDGPLGVAAVEVVAGEARAGRRGSRGRSCSSGTRRTSSRATARRAGAPSSASPTIWWPGTSGSFGCVELAVDDVQVGAADAAGAHAEQHLAGPRLGPPELRRPQRRPGSLEHHCPQRGALNAAPSTRRPQRGALNASPSTRCPQPGAFKSAPLCRDVDDDLRARAARRLALPGLGDLARAGTSRCSKRMRPSRACSQSSR